MRYLSTTFQGLSRWARPATNQKRPPAARTTLIEHLCAGLFLFSVFIVLLQERDDVLDLLVFLQSEKGHLRTGHECLRIFYVLRESLLVPCDAGLLVRVAVAEPIDRSCLSAE